MTTTHRVLLADYTTLHLGGPAGRFVAAETDADLAAAVRAADQEREPVLVLGGGSNLVVADEGFPGLVVLAAASGLRFEADDGVAKVIAAAGQDWDEMVRQCLAEGLAGIECLSGIPGSAGATPIQNVGAYGQEVAETISEVRAYDRLAGQVVRLGPADFEFGYRTSMFKRQATADAGRDVRAGTGTPATGRFVVLDVTFRLPVSPLSAPVRYGELSRLLGVPEGGRVPVADARAAVLELRRGKGMVLDPGDPDTRSAGSFFTNPIVSASQLSELTARLANPDGSSVPRWPAADGQVKLSAAWLIEHAGFGKGYRLPEDVDGARISTKHTLALTNPGQGSTASLVRLARTIRDGVRVRFGVDLLNEPTLVGVAL